MANENTRPVSRIWLECTRTWFLGGNTGIQRVVRNVVREATEAGPRRGIPCAPVIWAGFGAVQPRRSPGADGHPLAAVATYLAHVLAAFTRALAALVPRWLRRLLPRGNGRLARLRAFLASKLGGILASAWGIAAFPGAFLTGRRADFAPGDLLLLVDGAWVVPGIEALVAHARACGARVAVVVYDLIPVEHPAACPPTTRSFDAYLDRLVAQADFAVAISETTKRSLARVVGARTGRVPPTGVFRLGAELDLAHAHDTGDRLGPVLERSAPLFLTIGTLEPRKNQLLVLDALEDLWERGVDATLVVAGRLGFRYEYTADRIRLHPEHGRRLFLFEDLSDREFARLYERAAGVICASFVEGFGLPVVEALSHGVPVFASDIPAHREVGDKYCIYFNRRSASDLTTALEAYISTGALPPAVAPPAGFRWPDWWDSTLELLDEVERLAAATSKPVGLPVED